MKFEGAPQEEIGTESAEQEKKDTEMLESIKQNDNIPHGPIEERWGQANVDTIEQKKFRLSILEPLFNEMVETEKELREERIIRMKEGEGKPYPAGYIESEKENSLRSKIGGVQNQIKEPMGLADDSQVDGYIISKYLSQLKSELENQESEE